MSQPRSPAYRLSLLLGSGGHGEVYRATCLSTGEPVAVKLIRPSLAAKPSFVAALIREARILARLSHPNVVDVRELATLRRRPALVMELLEGRDLNAPAHRRLEEVVDILEQLLEGLAFIHDHGILHRDIKPANVFLTDAGRVVLTDFGVARSGDGRASTAGLVRGSLGYMAPERFRGESLPASDVYAAGLVAWELLAGQVACPPGEPAARMHWHLHVGPGDPRRSGRIVPDWLASVLSAMLSPDPHSRPVDGGAALALLRQLRHSSEQTGKATAVYTTTPVLSMVPQEAPGVPTAHLVGAVALIAAAPAGVAVVLLLLRLPLSLWLGGGAALAAVLLSRGRGGVSWATLWLLCASAATLALLGPNPLSWIAAALAGLTSWAACVGMRGDTRSLTFGELAVYLGGLGTLSVLFWAGVFALLT